MKNISELTPEHAIGACKVSRPYAFGGNAKWKAEVEPSHINVFSKYNVHSFTVHMNGDIDCYLENEYHATNNQSAITKYYKDNGYDVWGVLDRKTELSLQTIKNNQDINVLLGALKDNTYYDKTGKQILIGDLLKVYHFGSKNRTQYMYHVVVMEIMPNFPVMAVKGHYDEDPHCRMFSCADKETRVYKAAKIISVHDWTTKRKRIKIG